MPADRIEPTEAEIAAVHAALTGPAPAYDGPTNSLDRINLLARHVAKAMLSASPARGEGDAPVAWRFMLDGGWQYSAIDPRPHISGSVEPLFTHPTPATPAGEELREALDNLRDEVAAWSLEENAGHDVGGDYHVTDFLSVKDLRTILAALQPQAEGE